ncbi:CPBP family intramembrane glutamic endopeptidase [Psychroserpens sp. SPM9]|uniref:CPBP family intramembrane glutamic endopeptidase n=1 Tax=Psychroserpens sp. SPM9 TaxID=2975598 RepID=UPI0021A4E264|nr:CPBP family intramembrane glutamic endopeptidase [Psychroserpens sp. SPM9]MDG5491774.1 CPBP family intramembrane metalloprotease [Psychroserpens sp. SPM9]
MQSVSYKLSEFFIIFILVPVSFAVEYPLFIKMIIGLLGFLYVVFVLLRIEKNKFKIAQNLNCKQFINQTLIQLTVIAILTSLYMWIVDPPNLYTVIINKPLLWLVILLVYSIFSVYPQELIYRTFFFQRYQSLFKSKTVFIILNAALFSLAHLFFRNGLVMILTFIGGILFALTFQKTKSTLLVSVEHAIYGCWLFTVGMGNMLGFPS